MQLDTTITGLSKNKKLQFEMYLANGDEQNS